jgi:uncharacterized protein (TIGR03382 family)
MTTSSPSPILRSLVLVGRLLFAGVFLFAAWTKMPWVQPPPLFGMQIDSYQLLGPGAVMFVARTLPWFELILGLFLLIGWPLRIITSLASLTLLGFFSLMVRTYAAGLEINCGCFGPGERLGPKRLAEDGAMLALSLAVTVGAFLLRRRKSS